MVLAGREGRVGLMQSLDWSAEETANDAIEPMAYWIMGSGREFFDRQMQSQGQDTWDFGALAAIDVGDPETSLVEDRELLSVQKPNGSAWWNEVLASVARIGMLEPRIYPMPVRRALQSGEKLDRLSDLGNPPDLREEPKAIIGIIDHAICLPHERFRTSQQGSRILAAWHQSGIYQSNSAVPFGRELSNDEIESAISAANGDEDIALRELGMISFGDGGEQHLARAGSHGTHVLDLAAGADPDASEGAPPIIAVNLPPMVARETTGSFLGMFLISGVDYILRRARQIAPGVPVVINFSFALGGGPRGGTHPLTRCLYHLIEAHGGLPGGGEVDLVMAAGNRNLAQSHAWQRIKQAGRDGETARFNWKLQPGDTTSNMLEMWFSSDDAPDARLDFQPEVELRLTGPGGRRTTAVVFEGSMLRHLLIGGDVVGQVLYRRTSDKRMALSIILAPTDPGRTDKEPAPPGEWQVDVKVGGTGDAPVVVEAWVMRDDVVPGFHDTGRQSYLVDRSKSIWENEGSLVEWDKAPQTEGLRHGGNLNVLSVGKRVTCVGAAMAERDPMTRELGASPYSAGPLPGSSPLYDDEIVHESSVADRSMVRRGVLAAGTKGGTRVAMDGSSVAAPQTTRRIAESGTMTILRSSDPRLGRRINRPPDELLPRHRS